MEFEKYKKLKGVHIMHLHIVKGLAKIIKHLIKRVVVPQNYSKYSKLQETVIYLEDKLKLKSKIIEHINNNKSILREFSYKKDKQKLQEYLNTFDASLIPQATGDFRVLQLNLLDFAKQIISELEKDGLHPLLTGGCLIGAIRHKGFIPWDDDIDFDIMREEWHTLKEIFIKKGYINISTDKICSYKEFYAKVNIALKKNSNKILFAEKPSCISIFKGSSLADCLTIDFFPRDYINENISKEDYQKYCNIKHKFFKCLNLFGKWNDIFEFFNKELCNSEIFVKQSSKTAYSWGNTSFNDHCKCVFLEEKYIKPFIRITFEGVQFYTMQNINTYLKTFYGNYKSISVPLKIANYIKTYSEIIKKEK